MHLNSNKNGVVMRKEFFGFGHIKEDQKYGNKKNDMEKGVRDEKEEVRRQVMRLGALTQDTTE